MRASHAFGDNLDHWQQYQQKAYARIRYATVEANLLRHLPSACQRVLDAAGGNGLDAAALARSGHDVVVLDSSAQMLAEAAKSGLAVTRGEVYEVVERFGAASFDVVLCHFYLGYSDDQERDVRALAAIVRPGGFLSIAATNPDAEPMMRVFRDMDPAAALKALDERTSTGPFGTSISEVRPDHLASTLESAGCSLIARYGIQCVTAYLTDEERKEDPTFFADLLALELELTARHPYPLIARSSQYIAVRH